MTSAPESRPLRTRRVRSSRRRRGTVLLFALGVLAVISIAALSYVTFVRVDRQSSSAVAMTVGYDRQVGRVVEHIGSLIAADLFENKIVTTDVPVDLKPGVQSATPIWPTMFGDGEYRDYPYTNFATFNTDLPGKKPKGKYDNSSLKLSETPPSDDAWLAPLDPLWFHPGQISDQSFWSQITNLRSGWQYDTNATPNTTDDDRWIRGDGKYVDLGQLFTDYRTVGSEARGNPGTNLLDPTKGAVMPRDAAGDFNHAPFRCMNFMSGASDPVLKPSDQRFWADTDGDLRADARWQLIDSLGNLEGLLWVTAARIVDLSAMVNVNSAIEGGYGENSPGDYAEGRTPADVDLYRLLLADQADLTNVMPNRDFNWSANSPHPRPATTKLEGAGAGTSTFSDHLVDRLHVVDVLRELNQTIPTNWTWEADTPGKRLTPDQRRILWENLGSAPGRGPALQLASGPLQPGYAINDMVDLQAFAGSNNRSMLTELESTFDGPDDALGYLPRPEDQPNSAVGPLRSRERPGDTRTYSQANDSDMGAMPRADQLRIDPRRLLTTVSGVSDVSPVPVLNFKATNPDGTHTYYGQFYNHKIRLSSFSISDVPAAFQSFVWALAPFATDEYLTAYNQAPGFGRPWGDNASAKTIAIVDPGSPSYYYGGEDYAGGPSPARDLSDPLRPASVQYGDTSGAAFSFITSGALSINLLDASDADDTPSVARLLVSNDDKAPMFSDTVGQLALLGTQFSQGNIPSQLLPIPSVGNAVASVKGLKTSIKAGDDQGVKDWLNTAGDKGVTLVGLERHPYITEVFAFALYQNNGGISDQIVANDPAYQAGAVIAVQLANPYPVPIKVGPEYEITILQPGKDLMDVVGVDAPLRLRVPEEFELRSDTPITLIYTSYDPTKGDFSKVLGINASDTDGDKISPTAGAVDASIAASPVVTHPNSYKLVLVDASKDVITANPTFVTPFANEPLRVALRQAVPGLAKKDSPDPAFAVVDYMESSVDFFQDTVFDKTATINLRTYFDQAYFESVGYNFTLLPDGPNNFTKLAGGAINGCIGFTSSIRRPMKTATFGGFPGYIVGTRPADLDGFDTDLLLNNNFFGHAWLVAPTPGSPQSPAALTGTGFAPDKMMVGAGTGTGRRDASKLAEMHQLQVTPTLTKTADSKIPDRAGTAGGWQLFVPNRALRYVSELGQLCTYANMCKNNQLDNIGAWTTVGMQLRESLDWTYNKAAALPNNDNPYLGTLDFTRFLPTGTLWNDGPGMARDDSLALPLALRVFDCFEALRPYDTLAQGRININTAPERVLQMLPLMAPGDSVLGTLNPDSHNSRVQFLLQYRDAWDPQDGVSYFGYNSGSLLQLGPSTFNSFSASSLIRRHDASHSPPDPNPQYPYTTGFATAGELAFLDTWADHGTLSNNTGGFFPQGFVYPLGANAGDDGATTDERRLYEGDLDPTGDGIIDDPKERLALYRAVSNIVSSRSDVFGAWFILRGYDPKQIEAITVDKSIANPNARAADAMDNTKTPFVPVYESRWFVVFDRSNCHTPTDRPKVLLKAQLPSSQP